MSCDSIGNFVRSAWANVKLYNVILHGFAFMMIFTAFTTTSFTAKNVMISVESQTNGSYHGDAYLSSSIIYISLACSNWIAPVVISIIGIKLSLFAGAIPYCLYVGSFIYPMEWALYLTSVLIGIGAAVLWTAQGVLLTDCSDDHTMTRNSAIFWLLFQSSLLVGNLIEFVLLKDSSDFDPETRILLFVVLTCICAVGTLTMILIRNPLGHVHSGKTIFKECGRTMHTVLTTLKRSGELFKTKKILILSLTFAYSGLQNAFRGGIYPSCVGQNMNFEDSKAFIGIIGFTIGVAEVAGATLVMIIGKHIAKFGRDPLVAVSFTLHSVAYILTYLNFPDDCPIYETKGYSILSSRIVAIIAAFLLGFGDSLLVTAVYSILGKLYSGTLFAAPAFALSVFTQSLASAAAFFYASLLLKYQLLILVIMNFASMAAFVGVEFFIILKHRVQRVTPVVETPVQQFELS